MVTQNYTISTVKTATPPKVKMSQYDYGMRTITFAVVDGSGAAVELTGKTVTVEGTRIDGHAFATTCTVADNEATFVDTVDMTNAAGDHPAELVVRQNDERLGTMNFIISVEPAAMDEGADVSPEDKNLFEQLYAKVVSGSPVAVDTVAEMTNTDGVYLYTGNESGYTKGYWYYYDGSAWVAGGAYGSGATDKTLTLSDVAADAKVVGDYLDEISEGILESYVTEGSYTSQGVTTERISDTELKVYGTCTANRRFNVYNGFQTVRTTTSPFQEMLPAGTYRVSMSANKTVGNPRVTFSYTTYADALWTILNGQTVVYEFTQPFMFGFYANTNINYGTEDDPTIVTLRIESLTAKDEVARETKADKDGTYPDLTAGQLYTDEGVENVEPYFFRAVPAAASEARLRKLVGGTVAWNQRFPTKTLNYTGTGYTLTSNNDGVWTVTVTQTATQELSVNHSNIGAEVFTANHVHLLVGDDTAKGISISLKGYPKGMSGVFKPTTSTYSNVSVSFTNLPVGTYKLYPQVIDLTLALGSTIADYIYSLEQATAGAGVAFFRKYFPESYYAYNAGELKSVEGVSEKVTTGKNLFDKANVTVYQGYLNTDTYTASTSQRTVSIPCLPNTTYTVSKVAINGGKTERLYVAWSEETLAEDVPIYDRIGSASGWVAGERRSFTITTGATAKYLNVWISRVGEYEASLETCQIEIGSTATDYEPYVSHTYPLDSDLTLRGIPKLADGKIYFDGDEYKADGTVTRKYGTRAYQSGDVTGDTMITDGTNTVYKLATPTTETADPFTESEIIDPYGTEEFVSTGIVPVGHDTLYVDDLRQRLEDIAPPTTDGTYTLQVTVSGGKHTFAWVAANRSLSMGNPFASAAEDEPTEETTEETEEPVEEGDQR